jgi:hypothetical protein
VSEFDRPHDTGEKCGLATNGLSTASATAGPVEITLTGAAFALTPPALPLVLEPGARAEFAIRFAPAAAGSFTGIVSIASDDSDRPTLQAALQGTATAADVPAIDLKPQRLDHGSVRTGSTKDLVLAVGNTVPLRYAPTIRPRRPSPCLSPAPGPLRDPSAAPRYSCLCISLAGRP